MGLFSKLFGKKSNKGAVQNVREREGQAPVIDVQSDDDRMNWAMEKARLTLHYFEECLSKPAEHQQYFSIKVKIEEGESVEHIWLTNPSFDADGNLFGIVGNEPIDVTSVKLDQNIGIDRTLVSDWMIIENGRLIGGYTIRALRDNLEGAALEEFDQGLGGMYIDEGEDYFLPEDTTPEGAIVKIEAAYKEGDIDKIIACKDFNKEAELMLAKMGKSDFGQEILEKTAEVLQLSFIKSLQEDGIPKFEHIKQAFPRREKVDENHMIVTEVCYYPDGGASIQRLNTYKTENGWRVLNPVD